MFCYGFGFHQNGVILYIYYTLVTQLALNQKLVITFVSVTCTLFINIMIQDPMVANMAMQYGQTLANQGREYMDKKFEKYVSTSQIKYYFAVDTQYVMKKLKLLFFPYTHSVGTRSLVTYCILPLILYLFIKGFGDLS